MPCRKIMAVAYIEITVRAEQRLHELKLDCARVKITVAENTVRVLRTDDKIHHMHAESIGSLETLCNALPALRKVRRKPAIHGIYGLPLDEHKRTDCRLRGQSSERIDHSSGLGELTHPYVIKNKLIADHQQVVDVFTSVKISIQPLRPYRKIRMGCLTIQQRIEDADGHAHLQLRGRKFSGPELQRFHFRNPAVERGEVSPFINKSVDHSGPTEVDPFPDRLGLEGLECLFEAPPRLSKIDGEIAYAKPVYQPWIAVYMIMGDFFEPRSESAASSLVDERLSMAQNEYAETLPVLLLHQHLRRILNETLSLQERCGFGHHADIFSGRERSPGPRPQKLPEQGMILIRELGCSAPLGKIVAPVQVRENLAGPADTADLFGHTRGHAGKKGCFEQDLLHLFIKAAEHFFSEIIGYLTRQHGAGSMRTIAPAPRRLHEHHACGPPLDLFVDLLQLLFGQRLSAVQLHCARCLLGSEAKIFPPDGLHDSVRLQAGEHRQRVRTAYDDDLCALGNFGQAVPDHFVERRVSGDFLVIVEDDDRGRLQPAVKIFEVSLGECGNTELVFRGKERQGLFDSRRRFFSRQAHVIEEGGYVRVAFVHLIPQAGQLARSEVAGDQGGLAGAGRGGYPDHGPLKALIEKFKKPLPLVYSGYLRAGYLGNGDVLICACHETPLIFRYRVAVSSEVSTPNTAARVLRQRSYTFNAPARRPSLA